MDSGDKQRFSEAREELRLLLAAPQLAEAPLLVLANKQDLDYAASTDEIAEHLQLPLEDDQPPVACRVHIVPGSRRCVPPRSRLHYM